MLQDTTFVIFVTERFHWLLEPLLYMYRKYMPVPLIFFSDRLIKGVGSLEVFPLNMQIYKKPCGNMLKSALRRIHKPIVMLGYMDLLPIHKVDLRLLNVLERYMVGDKHVARGNIWSQANNAVRLSNDILHEGDGFSIRKLPSNHPQVGQIGCTSLLPSLWRRDFLLDFIEDTWTFDAIELASTKFDAQDRWYSIGMLPGLFDSCHLCYTSDKCIVRLSTIPDAEDRAYVAQFIPEWGKVE